MKTVLFFVISCLALHNGKGVPRTAVYNFVRCKPEGDQANCVTHQSPEMAWSPDLPAQLPASTAQYLEAEPVEGESSLSEEEEEESLLWEKEEEEEVADKKMPMMGEEREPLGFFLPEEGSGGYEGSAAEGIPMADQAFENAESEKGYGESGTKKDMKLGGDTMGMRRLFPSKFQLGEAKPAEQELREDHLLQL